jgi:hypothetical protein
MTVRLVDILPGLNELITIQNVHLSLLD